MQSTDRPLTHTHSAAQYYATGTCFFLPATFRYKTGKSHYSPILYSLSHCAVCSPSIVFGVAGRSSGLQALTFFTGMMLILLPTLHANVAPSSCPIFLVSCTFHLAANTFAISRHVHNSLAWKGFGVLVTTAKVHAGHLD